MSLKNSNLSNRQFLQTNKSDLLSWMKSSKHIWYNEKQSLFVLYVFINLEKLYNSWIIILDRNCILKESFQFSFSFIRHIDKSTWITKPLHCQSRRERGEAGPLAPPLPPLPPPVSWSKKLFPTLNRKT